jgi:hypothetical protein
MDRKFIFIFLFLGGFIGGYFPLLWGASPFSFSSVIWSAIGGLVGIYVGYNVNKRIN